MVMCLRAWKGVVSASLFLFLASCSYQNKPVILIVSNPIDLQRINEGVVVSMARLPVWVREHAVTLSDEAGRPVPSQRDDLDGDGKPDELYFQVSLAPWETSVVRIESGKGTPPPESGFKVFLDNDLVSIETPSRVLVSKGPEEIQVFLPGLKSSVMSAGYTLPGLKAKESQNRILSGGPLRVIVEQKALWRASSEAYIFNHRLSVALNDPMIRSDIEKIRWPRGTQVPPLGFELEEGGYSLKPFSTRWLLAGAGSKTPPWNAAFLFRAGTLLQPKPVTAEKNRWRQVFNEESPALSLAFMAASGARSTQEWYRLCERSQQRWLNPIEVFVSD
jgi:hypothetical protein